MHESVCMKPLLFVQQEIMIKERQLFSTFIVTRKIHSRSASLMGFLPSSLCFLTVSAASAQTY